MESGKPGRRLLGQVTSLRVSGACNTGLGGDWVQCALRGGGRRAEVMSRCDGVMERLEFLCVEVDHRGSSHLLW